MTLARRENGATQLGLAADVAEIYERTRAGMGDQDLEHIRHVAAYSRAIKARSVELLRNGGTRDAVLRGAIQYGLHTLLEFSELGHNILHGSYDELPNCAEFHSDRWQWDFLVDATEWKVMHHQNHHPFANIVEKDHDLGYSVVRLKPGQDWMGQHAAQLIWVPIVLAAHLYYFPIYTAISAARTEGRSVLHPSTYKAASSIIVDHLVRDYVKEPLAAGRRFGHTMLGNFLGTVAGNAATILLVALEHHTPNVEMFHDPGPDETPDQYYERQLRATTNFTSSARLDRFLKYMLSDVDFQDPPPFHVFYGGLDTHLEHHLFPDLPPNRQREIQGQVRELCERQGLPYNTIEFWKLIPIAIQKLIVLGTPVGEREEWRPWRMLTSPISTARRLVYGATFRKLPESPYLDAPAFFDAKAKILDSRPHAGGQARSFRIAKPAGWDDVSWDAGAFISVRIPVGSQTLVRQYSLVRDSSETDEFEICVKRVADGRVSNHLNDALRKGRRVTLVGPPTSDGEFIMKRIPERVLFIAGGVGITPIISMLRKVARDAPHSDATLLYFNRDEKSIIFEREIRELADSAGVRVEFVCDEVTSKRAKAQQGRISADLLTRLVPDLDTRDVYVCAPGVVIDLARKFCSDLGVPDDRFHTESFVAPVLERPTDLADDRYRIRFRRSNTEIEVDGCTTLLEAARNAGIDVPSGCERGLCRACVTGKLSGVTQQDEDGAQLARVTVCTSLPRSDVDLDL
jgi:stearoyl-CoA 9-desaturase NADPH oxidoreductase